MAEDINVTIGTDVINVTIEGGVSLTNVESDSPFYLDGAGGSVYFKYNSSDERIEFYIDDVLVGSYGTNTESDPFR